MRHFVFAYSCLLFGCGNSPVAPLVDAAPDASPDACVPSRTCESPSTFCGAIDDGCGTSLTCDACTAPLECGLTTPNVCGIAEANRVCNPGGWCWQHPLPFGMSLTSIYGVAANDVWATGEGGTLLRYDGTTWNQVASGTDANLSGVWGATANDIWITGDQYVRKYNGATVATVAGAPADLAAADVHGSGPNDVWVVGGFGAGDQDMWHWNGVVWTSYTNPKFFAPQTVFALGPTLAWAGSFGGASIWNGTAWTEIADSPQPNYGVWVPAATDAWYAGWSGVNRHDGTAWSLAYDLPNTDMLAVDGTSTTDVVVGGTDGLHHFDGTTWSAVVPTGAAIRGVMAQGPTRTWAAGEAGRLLAWNGTSWKKHSGFGIARPLSAIWAADAHDVWLFGEGMMRWRDGVVEDYGAINDDTTYKAAWGASANDIWAGGDKGVLAHWDGTSWSVTTPIPSLPPVNAMFGFAANNIYAVTQTMNVGSVSDAFVIHWDGTAWTVATTIHEGTSFPSPVLAIGGSGPNDVWAGVERGVLFHYDGATWSRSPFVDTFATIHDIWTSPAGTVWLATSSGVYRRSGSTWTLVDAATRGSFITGTSDTDVWVTLGNDRRYPAPVVSHYNGTTWTTENTGAGQNIFRLAITADSMFAAGLHGGVLRKPR